MQALYFYQLKTILEEIIATDTGNDFITFEIKDVAPIAVAKKYAGIGASLVAKIKNTERLSVLILVSAMLLYRSKKNEKSRHSLYFFGHFKIYLN